jgi:soluble P-type ATPase
MIELTIPGRPSLAIHHLVCDVEGTLTLDGRFRDDLFRTLIGLQDRLTIHLITVDSMGLQDHIDQRLNIKAFRIKRDSEIGEAAQKAAFIESLNADHVIAIGQGADDAEMLKAAALGISVLSPEGLSPQTLMAADLLVPDVAQALEAILNPLRIVNSLRR